MFIEFFLPQISDVCYLKAIHSISFKLTAFATVTYRYLHTNFLSSWISFKVTKILLIWVDKGMAVSYGIIGTRCIWNFEKILSLRWGMRDLWVLLMWFCLHHSDAVLTFSVFTVLETC